MPTLQQKHFRRYKAPLTGVPDLVATQKESYQKFLEKGLKDLFSDFSPIKDYSEKKFVMEIVSLHLDPPKMSDQEAKENNLTYEGALKARIRLQNLSLKETKEQEIFLADIPLMTERGTFIVNGTEKVVVPQLARSYGVFFTANYIRGDKYFGAKIIPARGTWIEIETEVDNVIYVRIDRKRKFPATLLLKVLGEGKEKENEDILSRFGDLTSEIPYIKNTLEKENISSPEDAFVEIYRKVRDSELVTAQTAKNFIKELFGAARYDLSPVGRFRFNKRFSDVSSEGKSDVPKDKGEEAAKTITYNDLVQILRHIIELNNDPQAEPDDIDHLGLRRVRAVGEQLEAKMRVGLTQMKRAVQDRMSTVESTITSPISLVNPRPLQARLKEFFNTNQLCQFMSQENILAELEHLRRLSALGPGGLTRERAGLEVRDVHPSHYGRVCPIQTPEGQNIGLILHMASYARLNHFGVLETPYRRVKDGKITDELVYLNALEEEQYYIAHARVPYDDNMRLEEDMVEVRHRGRPLLISRDKVDFIEVAANQAYSIATSCIPFLEHDDANRALMGSNMQKQATPCLRPEAPLVATGVEEYAARNTGRIVYATDSGTVTYVDANKIVIEGNGRQREYSLLSFSRTNGATALHHRPVVEKGQKVKKGDLIADVSTSDHGQLALGQNVFVAFMPWRGANYEDAIIISERLVRENIFSSIHIEEFEVNVRDTKLGPEVTTPDIPNVSEAKLRNLDEEGIIRIGAEVGPNDILVGKITPKGETELTPEERLLRSIFGEKARDVKDTSLRMEYGKRGRVIGVRVFSRERGDKLESGIIKKISIEVAQVRNVSIGDKLAGRHGNKGVIAKILPEEDMPYMEDGTPVDVILTPLGVPSRMNLGQILEMHLGLAAHTLNYQAVTPSFMGATIEEIQDELEKAGYSRDGKVRLFDGQTGEEFDRPIAVGYMYIMKLHHMVEDKIHMRSIGPYSLITQQPLGGKAQRGGQRFGEMEVWALEGYGAAHTLREVLTVKSDDIQGRAATFDSIVKGEPIKPPNLPASFNVLIKELQGLSLDVELLRFENNEDKE